MCACVCGNSGGVGSGDGGNGGDGGGGGGGVGGCGGGGGISYHPVGHLAIYFFDFHRRRRWWLVGRLVNWWVGWSVPR